MTSVVLTLRVRIRRRRIRPCSGKVYFVLLNLKAARGAYSPTAKPHAEREDYIVIYYSSFFIYHYPMSSAHVTSLAALSEFRTSLTTFIDEAKNAVTTLEMEIRRCLDWLDGPVRPLEGGSPRSRGRRDPGPERTVAQTH